MDFDLLMFTLKEICSDGVPSSERGNLGRVDGSSDHGNCGRNINLHYNVNVYT